MTITSYGTAAMAAQRSITRFTDLKSGLGSLQEQLSTGKKAQTYAGLGLGAAVSLDMRGQLTTLDGYDANTKDGQNRVSLINTGLTSLGKFVLSTRTAADSAGSGSSVNQEAAPIIAAGSLQQAIDILNTQANGRYLYSGRDDTTKPVADYDTILKGDSTHAGLTTLIAERKAADLGAPNASTASPTIFGRLTLASAPSTVTLGEDAAGSPFGLKFDTTASAVTSSSTAITATTPAGAPVATTLTVASQPAAGDTVGFTFKLPDGTTTTLTLTASPKGSATADNTFPIGDTNEETATNLGIALTASISTLAHTTLASASAMQASVDFFAGTATNPPHRVVGSPAVATSLTSGTAANTVIWYAGGEATGSVRETAPVKVGDGRSVGIGAQADEPAFQTVLASFAALASEFPVPVSPGLGVFQTDPTAGKRYAALSSRVSDRLGFATGQSVADVATDMSLASAAMKSAAAISGATRTQVQNTLDKTENADPNETAVNLLQMQTQLQASYQTTSTILKLSIVDYL